MKQLKQSARPGRAFIDEALVMKRDGRDNNVVGEIYLANEDRFTESYFSEALTAYAVGWKDPNNIEATLEFLAPMVPTSRRFEYASANNTENDLNKITTLNGFGYRTDAVPNTTAGAVALTGTTGARSASGILETTGDQDVFSFSTAGGACTGSGIGPTRITRVIGILKAYTTRVGSGPFPTELLDEDGERLRTIGGERGVTTGRPRRCGWFDAPIAKFATRVNGLTDIFLTKLDVLTGFDRIPVCVAYDVDGVITQELPVTQTGFHHAKPVYEYLPGWTEDISAARTVEDLPANAQAYVRYLEEISGTRISAIGVGQDRDETISIHDLIS
jgi:hypothetical protein